MSAKLEHRLREILRDRRTIVTLVFMPLLVYPLLSMVFQNFLLSSLTSLGHVECLVGVESEEARHRLAWALQRGNEVLSFLNSQDDQANPPKPVDPAMASQEPVLNLIITPDPKAAVATGTVDAGVILLQAEPVDSRSGLNRQLKGELYYREGSLLGKSASDAIHQRCRALNENFVYLTQQTRLPTDVRVRPITGSGARFSLTTLVPLILILMTVTGAVYPAIDLTAGERERGTLETLMAAPVPRLRLLLAKYVAVLTVALFTAMANLVAMTATLTASGLGPLVFGSEGLSISLVAQVFALLILFAAFFSAILLAVTSFARSFKEAQAYLIPLMLLALAPGIMSLMPELEFTGLLAVTPLVNIVLLARDIFEGTASPLLATIAVVSTVLYAAAAIGLAARIFGTDAILYGGQATWADLLRRPETPRAAATIPGALFCLATLFPLYFLLGNTLKQFAAEDMRLVLALSAAVTILLFLALPTVAAWFQRVAFRQAFQLRAAGVVPFLLAIVLGAALWPLAHEVFLLNRIFGIESLTPDRLRGVEELLQRWRTLSPAFIVLTLAITPAVCEEMFFRGYLQGAFQQALRPWQAVVTSAILFGAFHVAATSALSTERFLPSTFLGLVLGTVCYQTRSVLPGIVTHASHNGLLLMIAYYRDQLAARGWGVAEQTHLPAKWLGASVLVVVIASALLALTTRRHRLDHLPVRP